MPAFALNTRPCIKTLGMTALAAIVVATPAHAGKGNPAPIVFAGQNDTGNTSLEARGYVRPKAPSGKAGKRIQFRYPDQPDVVYGQQGPKRLENAGPIAFSSSKAAITTDAARQYASVQAPIESIDPPRHDPAISAGGFDAQAAARSIELQRRQSVVGAAPLAPLELEQESATVDVFDEPVTAVTYGEEYVGTPTANGEIYRHENMTAAHPSLPLPSLAQVINLQTGQEIVVRVNDRGPFEGGAGLQLSQKAAAALNLAGRGQVVVKYLGEAPLLQPQAEASVEPSRSKPTLETAAHSASIELAGYAPSPQGMNYGSGQGTYFVQLGSFSDIRNAEALQEMLGRHEPVKIQHAYVNGTDFFRVRVGPVMSQSEANMVRMRLAAQGFSDGNVVSE